MSAPMIDPGTIELRPGTRWVRLLLILRGGTYTVGEMLRLSRQNGVAFKIERNRISQAVRRMCDHGLTQYVHGFGWTATADGRAAVERFEALGSPCDFGGGRKLVDGGDMTLNGICNGVEKPDFDICTGIKPDPFKSAVEHRDAEVCREHDVHQGDDHVGGGKVARRDRLKFNNHLEQSVSPDLRLKSPDPTSPEAIPDNLNTPLHFAQSNMGCSQGASADLTLSCSFSCPSPTAFPEGNAECGEDGGGRRYSRNPVRDLGHHDGRGRPANADPSERQHPETAHRGQYPIPSLHAADAATAKVI